MARNCKNFDVRCPICAPRDPSKKKLAIHTEDDRVHCWVCGYKAFTLAPLIRKFGTQEQLNEYRRFMPGAFGSSGSRCVQLWITDDEPKKLELPKDFKLLAVYEGRDPDVLAIRRYLISRDISDDDVWYYKLGCSDDPMWRRRVIVPSFNKDGELNHYVGRTVDKFKRPKYETPVGERSHVIFNELNVDWGRRLVICEGSFDMMKCGDNVVPLLGSDLNEASALFSSILVHGTPIALALDADMRLSKTPRIAKKLMEYDIDVVLVDVPSDPGDMSKREFRSALAAAKPYAWEESFLAKLDRAARVAL